jgi:hypothetical protein
MSESAIRRSLRQPGSQTSVLPTIRTLLKANAFHVTNGKVVGWTPARATHFRMDVFTPLAVTGEP